jgi:hypothetical protein
MTTLNQLDLATYNESSDIHNIAMSGEQNALDTLIEQGCTFTNGWQLLAHPMYLEYWVESIRGLLSSDYHAPETIKYFASIGIEA